MVVRCRVTHPFTSLWISVLVYVRILFVCVCVYIILVCGSIMLYFHPSFLTPRTHIRTRRPGQSLIDSVHPGYYCTPTPNTPGGRHTQPLRRAQQLSGPVYMGSILPTTSINNTQIQSMKKKFYLKIRIFYLIIQKAASRLAELPVNRISV